MKIILSIILCFYTFKTFSQEKNCFALMVGPSECEFEIWKEKSDTMFCITKSIGAFRNEIGECGYYRFDLSQNKTWIFYSKDTLTLLEKSTIKDSLYEGENLKYYNNGNLKEKAFYVNGKLEGKSFKYYKNGQIKEYGEYKNGEVNGPFIAYYENGFIRWTSNYCDEHNVDVSYKYWDNMKLASIKFQMDKLGYWEEKIINMYFDTNGNAISEFEFKEMWNCNY